MPTYNRVMVTVKPVIYTIGHSTHTLEEFAEILSAHQIKMLVDVRTVPRSRRVPQFNKETLGAELARYKIKYQHLAELGGLRKTRADSINTAWRNASFRGFADYMQTPSFEAGLEALIEIASRKTTAIMCAEAVPWRCHRSLIGDALLARGWEVLDLFSLHSAKPHTLTSFARVRGHQVFYPASAVTEASTSVKARV